MLILGTTFPIAAQDAGKVDIIGSTRLVDAAQPITADASIPSEWFASARTGKNFHIVMLDLPSPTVEIEIGFAELTGSGAGERVFDMLVNERSALRDFDIAAEAGGSGKGVIRKFSITPTRGFLDFHFIGKQGDALVNFIRVRGDWGVRVIRGPNDVTRPSGSSQTNSSGAITAANDPAVLLSGLPPFDAEKLTITHDGSTPSWPTGMPLGGIGTGKIEMLPNGEFGNYTINNNWDLPVLRTRGTFIAVATKATSRGGFGRLMRVSGSDRKSQRYSRADEMSSVTFQGMYPKGEWEFFDDEFYLDVTVEGWSPIVPHNPEDSSLPGAVLYVELYNPKKYPVSTAVALSWEDINGRGGSRFANDQYGFAGNAVHSDVATSAVTGIGFRSQAAADPRRASFIGDYFIGTTIKGAVITRNLNWDPRGSEISWWKQFTTRLRLDKIPSIPAEVAPAAAKTKNTGPAAAAICVSFNMAPKERRRVPFIVTWNVPKMATLLTGGSAQTVETQAYAARFKSAVEIASYVAKNRQNLFADTFAWHDMMMRSNLPGWMKALAFNSLAPLTANSVHLQGGRFSMLESPGDQYGMIGPVDMRLGAHDFIKTMFPTLYAREVELYSLGQTEAGLIPRYVGNVHGAIAAEVKNEIGLDWTDATAVWLGMASQMGLQFDETSVTERIRASAVKAVAALTAGEGEPWIGNVFAQAASAGAAQNISRGIAQSALNLWQDFTNFESRTERANSSTALETQLTDGPVNSLALLGNEMTGTSYRIESDLRKKVLDQISSKNLSAFEPTIPLETDMAGEVTSSTLFFPGATAAGLASSAIAGGESSIGEKALLRIFQVAYGTQKAPWRIPMAVSVPDGLTVYKKGHISGLAVWGAIQSYTNAVYLEPAGTLMLKPVSPDPDSGDVTLPVFTPHFWAWLDFNVNSSTGTLTVTKTFGTPNHEISRLASNWHSDLKQANELILDEPFPILEGETLELNGWPFKENGTAKRQVVVIPVADDASTTFTETATTATLTNEDGPTQSEIIESGEVTTTDDSVSTESFGP